MKLYKSSLLVFLIFLFFLATGAGKPEEASFTLSSAETEDSFLIQFPEKPSASFASASYTIYTPLGDGYCPVLFSQSLAPNENQTLSIPRRQSVLLLEAEGLADTIVPSVSETLASGSESCWEIQSLRLCPEGSSVFDEVSAASFRLDEAGDESGRLSYHVSFPANKLEDPRKGEIVQEYWHTAVLSYLSYPDRISSDGSALPMEEWGSPSLFTLYFACPDIAEGLAFRKASIDTLDEAFYCLVTVTYTDGSSLSSGLLPLKEGASLSYAFSDMPPVSGREVAVNTEKGTMTFRLYEDHAVLAEYAGEDESLSIPESIEGLPVTEIGTSAFSSSSSLRRVAFPSSLTQIGSYAFYGTELESLEFPESLQYIGEKAFDGFAASYSFSLDINPREEDPSIGTLELGKHVKWIGESAFSGYCIRNYSVSEENPYYDSIDGCIYTEDHSYLAACPTGKSGAFQVPEGTVSVGLSAFKNNGAFAQAVPGCAGLTSLILPDSVEAFSSLWLPQNLTSLSIGRGLTQWEAIADCKNIPELSISSANPDYCIDKDAVYDKEKTTLFCYLDGRGQTEYRLPETLTFLEEGALSGAENLQSLRIPAGCTLSSMEPEAAAAEISGCAALSKIVVEDGNPVFSSSEGVLFSKDGSVLLCYPAARAGEEYTVPEGTQAVFLYAFLGSPSLRSLRLPASLSSLAFEDGEGGCLGYLPKLSALFVEEENPSFLAEGPFLLSKADQALIYSSGNYRDAAISLPEGTVSVADNIFSADDADLLTELHIPEGAVSIGAGNFNQIDRRDPWDILDLYLPDSLTDISPSSFQEAEGIVIHAGEGSAAAAFARQQGISLVLTP